MGGVCGASLETEDPNAADPAPHPSARHRSCSSARDQRSGAIRQQQFLRRLRRRRHHRQHRHGNRRARTDWFIADADAPVAGPTGSDTAVSGLERGPDTRRACDNGNTAPRYRNRHRTANHRASRTEPATAAWHSATQRSQCSTDRQLKRDGIGAIGRCLHRDRGCGIASGRKPTGSRRHLRHAGRHLRQAPTVTPTAYRFAYCVAPNITSRAFSSIGPLRTLSARS